MKKYTLFILILLMKLSSAQNQFQHIYGGVNHERGQTLLETFNNRFLLNGATTSYGQGSADAMMIKTDNAGNTIWSKVYGLSDFDNSEFAIEATDHGYVGVGRCIAPLGSVGTDAWIFKVDSNGVLQWSKNFGNNGVNDGFVQAINTADGGFAFIGNTRSIGAGSDDIFLVHTDANGDTIFTRSYGTVQTESGLSLIQTSNGDYAICGRQQTFPGGVAQSDGFILRTDGNGDLLWSKLYGDTLWEEFESIRELPNGDLVVAGSTVSFGQGDYDILVVRVNNLGNLISDFAYGGPKTDAAYNLIVNSDLSMVMSGYSEGLGYGHRLMGDDSTNIFLMKVQENGALDWMMTYGDGLQDEAYRSAKCSDGGYMISGYTTNYTFPDSTQMLFIKTDSLGASGCHEELASPIYSSVVIPTANVGFVQASGVNVTNVSTIELTVNTANNDACLFATVNQNALNELISVSPNPFTNQINLMLKGIIAHSISIYDVNGKMILNKKGIFTNDVSFNTSEFSKGFYVLKIDYDSGQKIVKLIK